MTPEEFEQIVKNWLATAKHPRFHRLYTDLVYQPMLEVLAYFRANGFKTFIVTAGGVEFVRAYADATYGVTTEQVIGSSIKTKFERRDGLPRLFRFPEVNFVDSGPGKPVAIESRVGRRPVAALGNSDGDLQMLQWTTELGGRRFGLIVHHTDAVREYAYDKDFDCRPSRPRFGGGKARRLDGGGHEDRLESDFSVRDEISWAQWGEERPRSLLLDARTPRKVVGPNVNRNRRQKQRRADPEQGRMMNAPPVPAANLRPWRRSIAMACVHADLRLFGLGSISKRLMLQDAPALRARYK